MTDEEQDTNDNGENGSNEEEMQVQKEMARMLTSVKDMALYNLSVISTQAWHHLGLVPVPGADDVEKDIEQAKMAIDLFEANLEVLAPYMEDEMKKQFKQTLMDLQLNYVNKKK